MSLEDWAYYNDIITFMKPMYLLVKELEGKSETSKPETLSFISSFDI